MNFSKKLSSTKSHLASDDEYSYNGSSGSFVDSEEDYDYQPQSKRTRTITNVSNNNGIQRRPTRVPNLKIQNRNALLARENRKRKKEMVDNLEKDVEDLQKENKKLTKIMKLKDARTLKLEQEVRYLKSVIANKTEIVSVLKSLPKFPTKSADATVKEEPESISGSETASCATLEEDNGSVQSLGDPFLSTIIDDDFLFPGLDLTTEWDEILRNPFSSATEFLDIPKLDDVGILSPPTSEISSEHNYFENTSLMNDGGAGVCVHINSGRVSLEFCSTCHHNALSTWIDTN